MARKKFAWCSSFERESRNWRQSTAEASWWKQKRENPVEWRYSRHASSFGEWKGIVRMKCVKPVNYSLACMSWDENCFRVSQFAIHLYERCFSATPNTFQSRLLLFSTFPSRGSAPGLLMEIKEFTVKQIFKWQNTWAENLSTILFAHRVGAKWSLSLCFSIYIRLSFCFRWVQRKCVLHQFIERAFF